MVTLNEKAFRFAKELVRKGAFVVPDSWKPPSADDENAYIEENGIDKFSDWHLGVDSDADPETKGAWKFIFTSDFENVDRRGIVAIRQRAGQMDYTDIFDAAGEILNDIDEKLEKSKSLEVLVKKEFSCETKRISPNVVDFIITTENVDRFGEKVVSKGCILQNYLNNPIVLFSHDREMPIGRCIGISVEDNRIVARTEFFPDLIVEPKAKTAVNLALNGVLKAVSIGFIPIETSYEKADGQTIRRYDKWELVEYSLVTIPANPYAVAKTYEKAGRVISQANLEKLESACDLIETALNTIRDLINTAKPATEPDVPSAVVSTNPTKDAENVEKIKIISFSDFVSQNFGVNNG